MRYLQSLEAVAPVCADEELPVLGGREDDLTVAAAANGGCGDVGYVSRARALEGAEAPLAIPASVGCLDDLGGTGTDVDGIPIGTARHADGADCANSVRAEAVQFAETAAAIVALKHLPSIGGDVDGLPILAAGDGRCGYGGDGIVSKPGSE